MDYPQEPKVYPGERIPTISDDLEELFKKPCAKTKNQLNMSKISEEKAERLIGRYEPKVKEKVNEARTFVTQNKTSGLTTGTLKWKANYLVEDLEFQFKLMKNRWDAWSIYLETEATFLAVKAKFEYSRETSKEALESLYKLIHEEDQDEFALEDLDEEFDEERQDEIALDNIVSAGRSGTEKLPESPDSTMTDSPDETFSFGMPDSLMLDSLMSDSSMPDTLPDTLSDTLPDPLANTWLDPIPPDILPDPLANTLLDPIPPDILLDAPVDSIAPAPALPWGERRGDGDHYAPVPYVDPGGRQPEVIGALCGESFL